MAYRTNLSRRSFLKASAAAGAIAGFPLVIPASARGVDGAVAPSNRITMGCIGVGGQGNSNLGNFLDRKSVV